MLGKFSNWELKLITSKVFMFNQDSGLLKISMRLLLHKFHLRMLCFSLSDKKLKMAEAVYLKNFGSPLDHTSKQVFNLQLKVLSIKLGVLKVNLLLSSF